MSRRSPFVVLGISGLHDAPRRFGAMSPTGDVGRHYQGYDAAAALFVDGKLVAAAQQERFTGRKFDHSFPADAIRSCLALAGLTIGDVTAVGHNFDYGPLRPVFSRTPEGTDLFDACLDPGVQVRWFSAHDLPVGRVEPVRHHDAHAWHAALTHDDMPATVVVADGVGETASLSIYAFDGSAVRRIRSWPITASLGLFYSLITQQLGWLPNSDEHMVMGLAAYGDPARYRDVMRRAVELRPDGGVRVRMLEHDTERQRWTHEGAAGWLAAQAHDAGGIDLLQPTDDQADLAAAAQERLVDAMTHVVDHAMRRTSIYHLKIGGGVALNCSMVGALTKRFPDVAIAVPYAAGDDGSSIGAALALHSPEHRPPVLPAVPLLGESAGAVPPELGVHLRVADDIDPDSLVHAIASLIAAGATVAWVQGRQEFGPRALGNRSLLADPRTMSSRDRLNSIIKHREPFRPLAPALQDETAGRYLYLPRADLGTMTVAVRTRSLMRQHLPAAVHVDGTARAQLVSRSEQPLFWRLIDAFGNLTGHPVLLNTSFNGRGQPIVRTATEAFTTFSAHPVDVLVVNQTVWAKDPWREAFKSALRNRPSKIGTTGEPR